MRAPVLNGIYPAGIRRMLTASLLLGILSPASCAATSDHSETGGLRVITATSAAVIGPTVARGRNGWLYYTKAYGDEDSPPQLWGIDTSGRAQQVNFPSVVPCTNPWLTELTPLPDGRLGATQTCTEALGQAHAVVLDPETGALDDLAIIGRASAVTWEPNLLHGWAQYDADGCASIARVDGNKVVGFPSYHPATLLPWALDGDFRAGPDEDCTPSGRAAFPVLAADSLLFMASPQSMGISPGGGGIRRVKIPWNLYELRIPSGELRLIVNGIASPAGAVMDRDPRYIIISAQVGGKDGLWRVRLSDGETNKLADGVFGPPSQASSDGDIVAVWYPRQGGTKIVSIPVKG